MRISIVTAILTSAFVALSHANAQVVYRINAGGPDYLDSDGQLWRSDAALGYYNVGESFAVDDSVEIDGTDLAPVYRSHRYDSSLANPEMTYSFPVAPGFYSVRLLFAETYWGFEGRRRFGVEIEGEIVLVDYDIVGLTGGKFVADTQQFVTQILDGDPTLTIEFTHGSIDHPLICGIVIESIPPSPIIVNGETAEMTIVRNSTCSNSANLISLSAVDPDTDVSTLQWSISVPPALGTASFQGGAGVGENVIVCYRPAAGQIEPDVFSVAVADGDGDNMDEIEISVAIRDTQAPILTCPDDITLDADAGFTPAIAGMAVATDDFGLAPVISYSDAVFTGTCPVAVEVRRTWTARDSSGNVASCTQRVFIRDNDTDGDGTVDCADVAPDDADVGGSGGDNGANNSNDNSNAGDDGDANANDNSSDGANGGQIGSGNSGSIVDPITGEPIPADACCGGGLPMMTPFFLYGWRRRRRLSRRVS